MDPLQRRALEVEEAGDLPEALELWETLVDKTGEVPFCLGYGRVAQKLEMWNEAERAFTKALHGAPKAYIITTTLGRLWLRRTDKDKSERLETAKHWFLESLKQKRHVIPLALLGATYVSLEDIALAREAFEEVITLDPNYEEAYYNLAVLEEETDPQRSRNLLERAVQIDPGYLIAHQVLARVCQEMEDLVHAEQHLQRCLEIDPANSTTHQSLGTVYQQMKDPVRAEYHLRRSLEIDPTEYWSNLFLANLLGGQKRNEEAKQTYRHAIQLRPDLVGGSEFFARFLESIGKDAEAACERAKANLPDRYAAGV